MKNYFNLGFIVLILVVLGCNCSKLDEFTKKNSTPEPFSTPYLSTSPTPGSTANTTSGGSLTKEKYDQIKKGMARADVEKLLGSSGEEVSSSSGGGHTYTVVKWADPSYAYIILTFDNNKVWTTSQGGLK